MKKMLALLLALTMAFALVACGGNNSGNTGNNSGNNTANDQTGDDSTAAGGEVYYLNFKPEQDAQWQELAQLYTEETGVPVTVVTAASGEYETNLMSEMGKSNPPTLFQVNGPVGLANWKDYCYDLSDSAVYGELTSDEYALKDGDVPCAYSYFYESVVGTGRVEFIDGAEEKARALERIMAQQTGEALPVSPAQARCVTVLRLRTEEFHCKKNAPARAQKEATP